MKVALRSALALSAAALAAGAVQAQVVLDGNMDALAVGTAPDNSTPAGAWGFPAFYWIQFLFILLGVTTTSIVYRMTRR